MEHKSSQQQLSERMHFRLELAESPRNKPVMLAISNDVAMKEDAKVGLAVRSDIQTRNNPNEIHTAHWRFFDKHFILNKKSGLMLHLGSDGRLVQRWPSFETSSERAQFNAPEFDKHGKAQIKGSGKQGHLMYHSNSGGVGEKIDAVEKRQWPRGFVRFGNVDRSYGYKSTWWRIVPASHETGADHPPLPLGNENVSLEVAQVWVGALQGAMGSFASALGNFGTDKMKIPTKASAVAHAATGVLGLLNAGLQTAELMDTSQPSEIEILYEALLPEVRGIVSDEISKAAIVDAKADIATAKVTTRNVQKALDGIVQSKLGEKAYKEGVDGHLPKELQNIALFDDSNMDTDIVANLIVSAHNDFSAGIAKLRVRNQIESTLGPFCMATTEHIGLLFLAVAVAPVTMFGILSETLIEYDDYITTEYKKLHDARMAQLVAVTDKLYSGSKSAQIPADGPRRKFYIRHVDETMKADFWPVFDHGAQIKAMRNAISPAR